VGGPEPLQYDWGEENILPEAIYESGYRPGWTIGAERKTCFDNALDCGLVFMARNSSVGVTVIVAATLRRNSKS